MGTLVTVHFIDGKTEALGQERTDDLSKEIGMDEGQGWDAWYILFFPYTVYHTLAFAPPQFKKSDFNQREGILDLWITHICLYFYFFKFK